MPFRSIVFLLSWVMTVLALGQDILSISPGAASAGMGHTQAVNRDVRALIGNPAGLGYERSLALYLSAERRFNNEALNYYSLAAALPLQVGGVAGAVVQYFGGPLYSERLLGLAYGRRLFDQLAVGAQFQYMQLSIPSFGQQGAVSLSLGLTSQLARDLFAGFYTANPWQTEWVKGDQLPSVFAFGLDYQPTDKVRLVTELQKFTNHAPNLKLGMQYQMVDQVCLRLGWNRNPAMITFGVGYQFNDRWSMDAAASMHQLLGYSPLAGLGYRQLP